MIFTNISTTVKVLICCIIFGICHANINNLKGTFSILKDEYKEFAMINGAIACDTDYLMHLYDFGTFGQEHTVIMPDKTQIDVPDPSHAPDIVKLVHLFCYRVPGTISRGEFVLADAIKTASQEDKINIVKAIAWTMAQVKKVSDLMNQMAAKKEAKKIAVLETQIQKLSKEFVLMKHLKGLQELANLPSTTSFADVWKTKRANLRLFRLIWDANLQEKSTNPMFPRYSTDSVLLGIVYKFAGDNKHLIRIFYEKFNEILMSDTPLKTIFVDDKPIPETWDNDTFDPNNTGQIAAPLTFDINDTQSLNQYYENLVYVALLPGAYPQIASYTSVSYFYDKQDNTKKVFFSDCMETTLRNLVNILLYDRKKRVFDLNNIPGIMPSQELKQFYSTNASASDTQSLELHKQWVPVIANIPFAAYNRKISNHSEEYRDDSHIGYIKIPQGISVSNKYIPVVQTDNIYEIRASLRNLIIVFNHIFGLDLFEHEQGNSADEKIATAFARTDFIKTYFPLMCEKLGIEFNGHFEDSKPIDNIDSKDYGPAITTKCQFNPEANVIGVEIMTLSGHGELKIMNTVQTSDPFIAFVNRNREAIKQKSFDLVTSPFYSIPYLVVHKKIPIITWLVYFFKSVSSTYQLNCLFYLPIDNPDFLTKLINILSELPIQYSNSIFNFFLSSIKTIPDENLRKAALLTIETLSVKQNKKFISEHQLIENAVEGIKPYNYITSPKAFSLFEILIEKDQVILQTINAASAMISTDDPLEKNLSLMLFTVLVKNGHGFNQALAAAVKIIDSNDVNISSNISLLNSSLELFKALVEKKQGFSQTIDAIVKIINSANIYISRDPNVMQSSLTLFKTIVEKEQGFKDAINVAHKLIKDDDYFFRRSAEELFNALLKKGQGFIEAMTDVLELIKTDYGRNTAVDLYNDLISFLKLPANKELPKYQELVQQVIELGEKIDQSTSEGKQIKQLAESFENEISQN